eukprot:381448-Pyramimonas_sp.AAC.1
MRLRQAAKLAGKLRWKITPKVHRLQHVPDYARLLNPRWVQNYGEESLVGTNTAIWHKTMRGRYQKSVQSIVLLKRTLGLLLRLETS